MAPSNVLAAEFDDEIVILDPDRGCLLQLDAWAAHVWRSCDGSTIEAIASSSRGSAGRVRETLHVLADAGLVHPAGDAWVRRLVEWV